MASARELITWAEQQLENVVADPGMDALILLSEITGLSRTHVLFRDSIDSEEEVQFRAFIERRRAHEPIQYITGRAYFRNLALEVGPGVLIPRPESESLVSALIARIEGVDRPKVLDLGAGSGALSIAIATERRDSQVTAVEKDDAALLWLRRNIQALEADINIVHTDVADFDGGGQFDAVIANPPYIPNGQALPLEVAEFEPHQALFGGSTGVELPQLFIETAERALKSGGYLAVEHHEEHGAQVCELLAESFVDITLHYDFNDRPRWSSGVRR